MVQRFYTIYKITNKINDKIYIGAHETSDLNDEYMGSGHAIKAAIEKHGIENFHKEIISMHSSRDEMYKEELRLVDESFVARLDTYNLRIGGPGNFHYINSNGLNNKAGQNLKGSKAAVERFNNDPDFRLKVLKHLEKHRVGNKSRTGQTNSPETRLKISLSNKGKKLGSENHQFGTVWIYHPILMQNKKIKLDFLNDFIEIGWVKGRKTAYDKPSLV